MPILVLRRFANAGSGYSQPGQPCAENGSCRRSDGDLLADTPAMNRAKHFRWAVTAILSVAMGPVRLKEEWTQAGCEVLFVERAMTQDPHDHLVLQIRGAVAEYERSLVAERMWRGRQAKLRAGVLLPWSRPPYGYLVDPDTPRDPRGVRLNWVFSRRMAKPAGLRGRSTASSATRCTPTWCMPDGCTHARSLRACHQQRD